MNNDTLFSEIDNIVDIELAKDDSNESRIDQQVKFFSSIVSDEKYRQETYNKETETVSIEDSCLGDITSCSTFKNGYIESSNISNVFSYYTREKGIGTKDSFYNDIGEYHGYIESIDWSTNTFNATLHDINDDTKRIIVEFNIDDIQYETDKDLLALGARIVWLVGQEIQLLNCKNGIKQGTHTNISKIIFRRINALSKRKSIGVKKDVKYWTEFFKKCSSQDSSD